MRRGIEDGWMDGYSAGDSDMPTALRARTTHAHSRWSVSAFAIVPPSRTRDDDVLVPVLVS
jgi:hypothetical protein